MESFGNKQKCWLHNIVNVLCAIELFTSKWSIKDTEIENRLTVTRGKRGGDDRGKGRRVCRNNDKGHMDNNKRAVETGEGGGESGREGSGEKAENCT